MERDAIQRIHRSCLMPERHVVELDAVQRSRQNRVLRARLLLHLEDVVEVLQRDFGLAINVDDVAQLLQWSEDKKRIEPQHHKLTDIDPACENQIEHQSEDARPERVHKRSLNEAQAPDKLYLVQFQSEDLHRRCVQPVDFLPCKTKALHELDIAKRLRC